MTTAEIAPLQSPLAAVQRLMERFGNQGVIIGGVAASVLGTPRLTADVAVISLARSNWPAQGPDTHAVLPDNGEVTRQPVGALLQQGGDSPYAMGSTWC